MTRDSDDTRPMDKKQFFREHLLAWFAQNHRPLPWKGEKDPYKIWLSEIILQQTRVEQGQPYYLRFTTRYPTVHDLAEAPEDEVLKCWEGLGYYSRARNLHAAAKYIAGELGGKFPDTFDSIRLLKGVGDYTAAAIASFAFNLPHAVLDGNVYRVLARFFGIETPSDTPAAKKEFSALAQELLPTDRAAGFNQAIMDFGATQCTPQQPRCTVCPMQANCSGFRTGKVSILPVKSKKPARKERFFIYLAATFKGNTYIRKRSGTDIWRNLYEFPLYEADALPPDNHSIVQEALGYFFPAGLPAGASVGAVSGPYRQTLTHRLITAVFCEVHFSDNTPENVFNQFPFDDCIASFKTEMKKNIAVPRVIDWYLQENVLTLRLI